MFQLYLCLQGKEDVLFTAGWILFAVCLMVASIMDCREQMVYRFVWLIAGLAAGVMLISKEGGALRNAGSFLGLVIFVLLQEVWFSKFYGRADCHAFSVCAVVMAVRGLSFRDYVMHMFVVFVALTVVQLVRGNVTKSGRLKKPVPLIPYIMAGFWLWVDFAV